MTKNESTPPAPREPPQPAAGHPRVRDARAQFDESVDVSKIVPTNTVTRERMLPSERPPVPRPRQTSVRPVLKSVDPSAQPNAPPQAARSSPPPALDVADQSAEEQRSAEEHVRTLTGLPAPHPNPQRDFASLHERAQMNRQATAIAFPAPPHLSPVAPSVVVAADPLSSVAARSPRQPRVHFGNVPAVLELDEDGTRPAARGRSPRQSGLPRARRALAFCGFLVLGCAVSWYLSSAYLNGEPTRPQAPASSAPVQRPPAPSAEPTAQHANPARPDNTAQGSPPNRPAMPRPTDASVSRAASRAVPSESRESGQNAVANSAPTPRAVSSASSVASPQQPVPPARSASGPTLPFGARLASPED